MSTPLEIQRQLSRVLLFFARQGAAAWIAHLDTMRLFERAFNRAQWPVAWTEDAFNPRPMLVFGLPAGVGIETRRDPLEVTLETPVDMNCSVEKLNRLLPPGVEVVAWGEAPATKKSLMSLVKAADYLIEAPEICRAFEKTFSSRPSVIVPWARKGQVKEINLTPRILDARKITDDTLCIKAGAGSENHLRVDLLLEALVRDGGLSNESAAGARIIR